MNSIRIDAILSFLNIEDAMIDIGCDHAYVPILMAKKGCGSILATDIHEGALEIARENIKKENLEGVIDIVLSDGLKSIDPTPYDTLVIAGMGASTIKHILADSNKLKTIQKIILQSNNDLYELRLFLQTMGYSLVDEKIIQDRGHFYSVLNYKKGQQRLTDWELEFGLFKEENLEYYEYLKKSFLEILKKIPKESLRYQEYERKLKLLTSL